MRENLRELDGKRQIYIAEFTKVSGKKMHSGTGLAVLLRNIKTVAGQHLADHVWIDYSPEFNDLQLKSGEQIIFRARVRQYRKGKFGQIIDYNLHSPSSIQRYGEHHFRKHRRKRGTRNTSVSSNNVEQGVEPHEEKNLSDP